MRKVQFLDKNVKAFYNSLINEYQGLSSVIDSLLKRDELKILDIANDENFNLDIEAKLGQAIINIIIDFKINKIHVISSMGTYKETYENYKQRNAIPILCQYQNKEKIIIKRNYFNVEDGEIAKYYYEIKDHNNVYNLLIIDKDSNFDEKEIIQRILYSNITLNNIRDLLIFILNDVNNRTLNIKICDDKGSFIEIDEGEVINYNEVFEVNGEYQRITLEDNDFYIESKVKEIYEDNLISYIKKIGEYDGKEKK